MRQAPITLTMASLLALLFSASVFAQTTPTTKPAPTPAPAATPAPTPAPKATAAPPPAPKSPGNALPGLSLSNIALSATTRPATAANAAAVPPAPAKRDYIFQFGGTPYVDVIKRFAQAAKRPLIGDIAVDGQLTFYDSEPYSYEEALETLNTLLAMRGYCLMEQGRYFRCVPLSQVPMMDIKIFTGLDKTQTTRPSEIVTVLLPLKYIDAEAAAKAVVRMVSAYGSIAPMTRGKGVVITDQLSTIQRIKRLLDEMDKDSMTQQQIRTIALKQAQARNVQNVVNSLFAARREGGGPNAPAEEWASAVSDERTNTIILMGTGTKLALAEDMVKQLDSGAGPKEGDLRIYELKNAKADQLANTLRAALTQGRSEPIPGMTIVGDAASNRLIVSVPPNLIKQVDEMVAKLDVGATAAIASGFRVFRLKSADANQLVNIVQVLMQRGHSDRGDHNAPPPAVMADQATNSMIVSGMSSDIELASTVVKELDTTEVGEGKRDVQVVPLKGGKANEMANLMRNLFSQQQARRGQPPVNSSLRIEPDPSGNSLIISASPGDWAAIQEVLKKVQANIPASAVVSAPVTRLVIIKNGKASELAQMLGGLYSRQRAVPAIIVPSDRSNTLLVSATPEDQTEISELLKTLDAPSDQRQDVQIISLTGSDAAKLVETIRAMIPPDQQGKVQITADVISNSVLLRAPASEQKLLAELISKLDVQIQKDAAQIQTVQLKNVPASQMAPVLMQIYSRQGSAGMMRGPGGPGGQPNQPPQPQPQAPAPTAPDLVIVPAPGDKAIIISAPGLKMTQILAMVKELDVTPTGQAAAAMRIVQIKSGEARKLADAVRAMIPPELTGQVQVVADPGSNSVILRGPETARAALEDMIAKLDTSTRQGVRQTKIVKLTNVQASQVAATLSQLYSNRGEPMQNVVIAAAPGDRQIVIDAPTAMLDTVTQMAASMDIQDAVTAQNVRVYAINKGSAKDISASLSRLYQQREGDRPNPAKLAPPRFEYNDTGNQLIVSASDEQFKTIDELVKKLETVTELTTSTRTFKLKFAKAKELADVLQSILGSAKNQDQNQDNEWDYFYYYRPRRNEQQQPSLFHVAAIESSNSLIVQGSTDKLALADQLVKTFDVAAPENEKSIQIIQLKNAKAQSLAASITKTLSERTSGGENDWWRPAPVSTQKVTITAEPNTNSVLVRGLPADLVPVLELIKKLDSGGEQKIEVKVYPLHNSEATDLVKVIGKLMNDVARLGKRGEEGPDAPDFSIAADERTNSLIVSTTSSQFKVIENLLASLDKGEDRVLRDVQYVWLTNAQASDVVEKLDAMYADRKGVDKPVIEADSIMNAVTIIAKEADLKTMQDVIAKLDSQAIKKNIQVKVFPLTAMRAERMAEVIKRVYGQMTNARIDVIQKLPARESLQFPATRPSGASSDQYNSAPALQTSAAAMTPTVTAKQSPGNALPGLNTGNGTTPTKHPTTVPAIMDVLPVTISVDKESNSLIVSATRQELENIDAFIMQLTSSTSTSEMDVKIYKIKSADVTAIARTLDLLFNPQAQHQAAGSPAAPAQAPRQGRNGRNGNGGNGSSGGQDSNNPQPQPQPQPEPAPAAAAAATVIIVPDARTKTLIVRAKPVEFEMIELLLAELDKDSGTASELRVFTLKNADANEVAANLKELFQQAQARVENVQVPPAQPNQPGQPAQPNHPNGNERRTEMLRQMLELRRQQGQPADSDVSISANRQSNSIVVAAPLDAMKIIESLVKELDQSAGETATSNVRVFPIKSGSAEAVAKSLREIFADGGRDRRNPQRGSASAATNVSISANEQSKVVIVQAPSNVLDQIEKIIATMSTPVASEKSEVLILPLKKADATRLAEVLNNMFRPDKDGQVTPEARSLQEQVKLLRIRSTVKDEVPELDLTKPIKLTADGAQGSNSLVISSTPDNLKAMRAVVEMMDMLPVGNGVVVRVAHLEHADATSVMQVLREVFDQGQKLTTRGGAGGRAEPTTASGKALTNPLNVAVDPRTNTLVLAGVDETVALAEIVIKDLDRENGKFTTEVRLFKLKNANATSLAELVRAVFAEGSATPGAEGLQTQITRLKVVMSKGAATQPGADPSPAAEPAQTNIAKARPALTVQSDATSNILIVAARSDIMPLIADVVQTMDIAGTGATNKVRILPLVNADATRLQQVITTLYSGASAATVRPEDKPTVAVDTRTNALVVSATDKTFEMIEQLLAKLDAKGAIDSLEVRLLKLKNVDAGELGTTLQKIMEARVQRLVAQGVRNPESTAVTIVPDTRSNSLIIGGSAEGYELIKTLVAQLDVTETALSGQVQMIPLTNANAVVIAPILENLFTQRYQAIKTPDLARQKPIILSDSRSNSLMVSANTEDSKLMMELLKKLDVKITNPSVGIHVVPLKFNDAATVGATIKGIFAARLTSSTPSGQAAAAQDKVDLEVEAMTNSLIIACSKENLDLITELLAKVDVEPSVSGGVVRIFPLVNASAANVQGMIQGLLTQGLYKPGATLAGTNSAASAKEKVAIVADVRMNLLVVSASKENFAIIEQILKSVDVKSATLAGDMRVYPIRNADVTKLAPMLSQFFTAKQAGEKAVNANAVVMPIVIVPDARTNTLLVAGGKENFEGIEQMISKLDGADIANSSTFKVFQLRNATAATLQPTLKELFQTRQQAGKSKDPATVLADQASNALLIGASPEDMSFAETIIRRLDTRPENPGSALRIFPMVHADATNVAKTLQDLYRTSGTGPGAQNAVAISVDERINAILVTAGANDLSRIDEMVRQLDRETLARVTEIRVFPLSNADATQMATILGDALNNKAPAKAGLSPNRQALLQFVTRTKEGKDLIASALQEGVLLTPDARTNSLVVSAPVENMPLLDSLIKALDTASPTVVEIKIFPLKNAAARQMADILTKLFRLDGSTTSSKNKTQIQLSMSGMFNGLMPGGLNPGGMTSGGLVSGGAIPGANTPGGTRGIRPGSGTNNGGATGGIRGGAAPTAGGVTGGGMNGGGLAGGGMNGGGMVGPGGLQPGVGMLPVGQYDNGGSDNQGNDVQPVLSVTVDPRTNSLLVAGTKAYLDMATKVIEDLDSQEAEERKTQVYRMRNSQATDIETALRSFLDQERQRLMQTLGQDAIGAAEKMLEREVAVVAEKSSNTLLVSASPKYFETIAQMIHELDQAPPQVLIQVLLAEVALDDTLDLGMEWSYATTVEGEKVKGGTNFGLSAVTNGFTFSVTGDNLNLFLRAMQSQGRVEVLSRPQILASDNMEASINVGQEVPFIRDNRITESGTTISTIEYENVGIILNLTPRINHEGMVKLDVAPEISSLSTSSVQISPGVFAPIINSRKAKTTVTVQDGHTVILGGLITTSEDKREEKVPVVGDIPLLGWLFKHQRTVKARTELLIILTPHVVRNPGDADTLTDEQIRQMNLLRHMKVGVNKEGGACLVPTAGDPAQAPTGPQYGPRTGASTQDQLNRFNGPSRATSSLEEMNKAKN